MGSKFGGRRNHATIFFDKVSEHGRRLRELRVVRRAEKFAADVRVIKGEQGVGGHCAFRRNSQHLPYSTPFSLGYVDARDMFDRLLRQRGDNRGQLIQIGQSRIRFPLWFKIGNKKVHEGLHKILPRSGSIDF